MENQDQIPDCASRAVEMTNNVRVKSENELANLSPEEREILRDKAHKIIYSKERIEGNEIDVEALIKGDYITEKDGNFALRMIVIETAKSILDPKTEEVRFESAAVKVDENGIPINPNKKINLMVVKGFEHYGPELYLGKNCPYLGIIYL